MATDEPREAAAIFRRLLAQVEEGRLGIGGEHDVALLRRIEGAAGALEAAAEEGVGTGALLADPDDSRARGKPRADS